MKTAAIQKWLWRTFIFWTVLESLTMPWDVGPAEIARAIGWMPLQRALIGFIGISDAIWLVLGASCLYFYLIQQEGLKTARRVTVFILATSFVIEAIGVKTAVPFGPYIYTFQLGNRILGVPFTIPLLWLIVVCCSRYTVLHFFSHARRWQIALGTGLLAVGTDVGLEWVAWRVRAYRLWYFPAANTPDWPPLQNYLAWFVISAVLAWVVFPAARPVGKQWQPVIMLGMINLLFWVTILVRLGG